ncbi:MAG: hypothetical protein M3Y91_06705 [Actinomycetota bacterium]|nr:hypothetical protein [Actinomycetota bacterium]
MSVRVTVEDLETGQSDSAVVKDGDYVLVVADPCHLDGVQTYKSGATHVLTVKGRIGL